MKRIKTLTVGGETYRITDPEAARIDDTAMQEETVWSGKHTVDMLAPAFLESGSIVACQPVAGYPLTVQAQEGSTVTRCGKNLWDLKPDTSGGVSLLTNFYADSDFFVSPAHEEESNRRRYGYKICLPAGTYTLCATGFAASSYLYGAVNGEADGAAKFKGAIDLVLQGTPAKPVVVTLDAGDVIYLYNGKKNDSLSKANELFTNYDIQVELGDTATDYEQYRAKSFAYDTAATVPALSGINTLWADAGSIPVCGRQDPAVLLEKMKNALASLGGAV